MTTSTLFIPLFYFLINHSVLKTIYCLNSVFKAFSSKSQGIGLYIIGLTCSAVNTLTLLRELPKANMGNKRRSEIFITFKNFFENFDRFFSD
jgi:hypothetical protein